MSAAEALLAIWAPGLVVMSECPPYCRRADGYIRRHCARSFSTALRLLPFNEASRGALEGRRRNMFLSTFIKKHSWEKTVDFIPFPAIHWTKLTCKWQSSFQRWEFFFLLIFVGVIAPSHIKSIFCFQWLPSGRLASKCCYFSIVDIKDASVCIFKINITLMYFQYCLLHKMSGKENKLIMFSKSRHYLFIYFFPFFTTWCIKSH